MPLHKSGMIRKHHSRLAAVQRLIDLILIMGILYLSIRLRGIPFNTLYVSVGLLTSLLFYFVGETFHLYQSWRSVNLYQELQKTLTVWVLILLLLSLLRFLFNLSGQFSRLALGYWFVFVPVAMILWRIGLRLLLYALRQKGYNTRTVAIAGPGDLGVSLFNRIEENQWLGYRFLGFFDDYKKVLKSQFFS